MEQIITTTNIKWNREGRRLRIHISVLLFFHIFYFIIKEKKLYIKYEKKYIILYYIK
jgi:hypothetical protein